MTETLKCTFAVFIHNFRRYFQITGYGCCSLPALYRTRCISAASSRSVTDALHEAYALNPDCIVTNCLDVMNEEVLKLLETFGKQGKILYN